LTKIAVLSDIHANIFALEIVLKDIKSRNIDEILCLGDVVGYYPYPNKTIELVKKHCSVVMMGNHDAGVVGIEPAHYFNTRAYEVIEWTKQNITQENYEWLRKLPLRRALKREGKNIYLVHGSPFQSFDYMYIIDSSEEKLMVKRALDHVRADFLFVGHTHIPIIIEIEDKLFLNPGSVGQPRHGVPGAFYAIVDVENIKAEIIHLEYDFSTLQKKVLELGLPEQLAERLNLGL